MKIKINKVRKADLIAMMQALREKGWWVTLTGRPKGTSNMEWFCKCERPGEKTFKTKLMLAHDPAVAVQQVWDAIHREEK